jgi:hypothetical protein
MPPKSSSSAKAKKGQGREVIKVEDNKVKGKGKKLMAMKAMKAMKVKGKKFKPNQGYTVGVSKIVRRRSYVHDMSAPSGSSDGGGSSDVNNEDQLHPVYAHTDVNQLVEVEFDVKHLDTLNFVMKVKDLVGDGLKKDQDFVFKSIYAEKHNGQDIQRLERINIPGLKADQHGGEIPAAYYLRFVTKYQFVTA